MLANTALYAAKKRKKPVQKIPKPPPPDGIKSNPSKRHRDRLNGELDKLTGLLPLSQEVRARLDKLSVLRLSVGYLKVKSFFTATMKKGQNGSSERSLMFGGNIPPSSSSFSQVTSIDGVKFNEGDLLLQALSGFVLVVTAEGYVFYTSPTIQDFLGFHQSDVVHQSVFELIHTDDRALFRRQLHFALNPDTSQQDASEQSSAEVSSNVMTYDPRAIPPENSSFLERNFCCRFRCLLDNSSGFLAMNFHGRLKFIHGQNRVSEDGAPVPPQLALFAIATQMQRPSILEIRTKTLMFQTKHKLDFTPMGIDNRGKVVLGYNEVELCMKGSGYNFIHTADMMYCADNHLRMMKTGESGFTVFRLLSKTGVWIWVQANARLVFKAGKPDFIVARQRALLNEEGEDQLRLRRLQLPFNFTTGEALLYDITPTVDAPDPCSAPKQRKLDDHTVSRESMMGCMLSQNQSLYCDHNKNNAFNTIHDAAFKHSHATLSVPGDAWELAAGGAERSEATVQDMMETLQQILGDDDLGALDIEPEELKSWESTLLKMSSNICESNDHLDDILTYVEEQLQREGGLQNQQPGPAPGHMKLTHMDLPPLGFNGPTLGLQLGATGAPVTFNPSAQNHLRTVQVSADDNNRGFSPRRPSANQIHPDPAAQPMQSPRQARAPDAPAGLRDPSAGRPLTPGFNLQENQWSSDPAGGFVEAFGQSPVPGSSSASCALKTQSHGGHRAAWPPEQPLGPHQASAYQRNPLHVVNGGPMFRTPETSGVQLPVQRAAEPPSSCMFRSVALSGRHLAGSQAPPMPSCLYQGLPGGGAGPDPNELDVLPPPPPHLDFSEQTQVSLDTSST
ncbi:aryl hydrocarbon receptor 2 isoform X2 [Pseudoliparis swirei]|uniref:aryl hydrocarbon receptor 2 isoform X2 n=1 Tax=Pseudoliparis swirei TaxID=2059687 RepID=UPI0024BEF941|nr:aryl hydrocarbon receptor 2 isoform X2 [Pseudoliparis swirei]